MTIKDVIASCLVISLGIILVMHFILFWIYGGVFIYENNKIILLGETIMSVAIIGFGIERLLTTANVGDRQSYSSLNNDMSTDQGRTEQIMSLGTARGYKERAATTDTMTTARPRLTNLSVGNSDSDHNEYI